MSDSSVDRPLPAPRATPPVTRAGEGQLPPWAPSPDPFGPGVDELLTLSGLLRVFLRRWMWALPVFVAVVAWFAWRHKQQTPIYGASTTLRFTLPDERIASLTNVEVSSPGARLATEMLVLRSQALAAAVAARTHYALQLVEPRGGSRDGFIDSISIGASAAEGTYTFEATNGRGVLVGPRGTRMVLRRGDTAVTVDGLHLRVRAESFVIPKLVLSLGSLEGAAGAIRGGIYPSQPNYEADVVDLSFRGTDPGLVRTVADAAAERFIVEHAARRQAGGRTTASFVAEQLVSLDGQLREAELRLRAWRETNRVILPGAEAGAAVASRTTYEGLLRDRRSELAGIEAFLREGGAMPGWRQVLSSGAMEKNSAGSAILTSVLELESQRTQLLARRTREHPEVQLVDGMLADYAQQGEAFVRSYVKALQSQIRTYEGILSGVGNELARIPRLELELKTLERDVQVLSGLQLTLQQRLKETQILNAADQPLVEVLDHAEQPGAPLSPDRRQTGALALMFGVLAAGATAVLRDRLDKTVHTREEVERLTGAPMLALIPSFNTRPPRRPFGPRVRTTLPGTQVAKHVPPSLIAVTEPRHVSAEAYRMLQANLRFAPAGRTLKVTVIGSAMPSDGKSTTSANLAATLAVQGKRVLLIDADMRRGELHRAFGAVRAPGLAELLSGQKTIEQVVRTVRLDETTRVYLISSSDTIPPPNPTELLGSPGWPALLQWARETFDEVLVDTPPTNMFADAMVAAMYADGVLLLARAGKSSGAALAIAAGQLRAVQLPLLGVVLNDFHVKRDARYGGAFSYRKYYNEYYKYYSVSDTSEPA